MSDQIDSSIRNIIRNKEGHYITIHQEDILILNVYASNKQFQIT